MCSGSGRSPRRRCRRASPGTRSCHHSIRTSFKRTRPWCHVSIPQQVVLGVTGRPGSRSPLRDVLAKPTQRLTYDPVVVPAIVRSRDVSGGALCPSPAPERRSWLDLPVPTPTYAVSARSGYTPQPQDDCPNAPSTPAAGSSRSTSTRRASEIPRCPTSCVQWSWPITLLRRALRVAVAAEHAAIARSRAQCCTADLAPLEVLGRASGASCPLIAAPDIVAVIRARVSPSSCRAVPDRSDRTVRSIQLSLVIAHAGCQEDVDGCEAGVSLIVDVPFPNQMLGQLLKTACHCVATFAFGPRSPESRLTCGEGSAASTTSTCMTATTTIPPSLCDGRALSHHQAGRSSPRSNVRICAVSPTRWSACIHAHCRSTWPTPYGVCGWSSRPRRAGRASASRSVAVAAAEAVEAVRRAARRPA